MHPRGRIAIWCFSIQFGRASTVEFGKSREGLSKKMSIAFVAACKRLARSFSAAIFLIFIGAFAGAQSPTPDPLSILKGLSQDQQDALMQSVLGKSDGTSRKTDSQLNTPETVQKMNDRTGAAQRDTTTNRDKSIDGRTLRRFDEDPELRAGDTVLIDLTPVELALKDGSLIAAA